MSVSTNNVHDQRSTNVIKKMFYRPPFIGMLAFLIVFITQGLGHTVMVGMEMLFGHEYQYQAATFLGLVGAYLLYLGMKNPSEVAATWLGFSPVLSCGPVGWNSRSYSMPTCSAWLH